MVGKTIEYFQNRHSMEMGTGIRGEINLNIESEFITSVRQRSV